MKNNTYPLKANPEIQEAIQKVESGLFDDILSTLSGRDLGIYISAMTDIDGNVIPMPEGYSQSEHNLEISVAESGGIVDDEALPVGWFLKTSGQLGCTHCNNHTGGKPLCVHCGNHKPGQPRGDKYVYALLDKAGPLDPHLVAKEAQQNIDVLKFLGMHGLGLYMLHGHIDKYPFTKLPKDVLSVIENGKTEFIQTEEIKVRKGFVPTIWRFEDGARQVAGGFM